MMSWLRTRLCSSRTPEERIREAVEFSLIDIGDLCSGSSDRITAATYVLAATLRANVSEDAREQALGLAMKQVARILGVRSPAGDAEPAPTSSISRGPRWRE